MNVEREPRPMAMTGSLPDRAITAQRLKYEAEIKVFTTRFGDLENVRKNLGFSRRRMCQLLLVDPSAWTRWHSPGNRPPPHVYRALEWFLILEGKSELHPKLADLYLKPAKPAADHRLDQEIARLRAQLTRVRTLVWVTPILAAAASAAAVLIFR